MRTKKAILDDVFKNSKEFQDKFGYNLGKHISYNTPKGYRSDTPKRVIPYMQRHVALREEHSLAKA